MENIGGFPSSFSNQTRQGRLFFLKMFLHPPSPLLLLASGVPSFFLQLAHERGALVSSNSIDVPAGGNMRTRQFLVIGLATPLAGNAPASGRRNCWTSCSKYEQGRCVECTRTCTDRPYHIAFDIAAGNHRLGSRPPLAHEVRTAYDTQLIFWEFDFIFLGDD